MGTGFKHICVSHGAEHVLLFAEKCGNMYCLYMDKSLWEDVLETDNICYFLEEKYKVALPSKFLPSLRTSFFFHCEAQKLNR